MEIVRVRRGVDPDLIVRLADGLHAAIAMSWTDYTAPLDRDPPPVATPLLDIDGLRQVVQFIERLRQVGRYPGTEVAVQTCPPGDSRYD